MKKIQSVPFVPQTAVSWPVGRPAVNILDVGRHGSCARIIIIWPVGPPAKNILDVGRHGNCTRIIISWPVGPPAKNIQVMG
jgi:hypothetical protein